MTVRKRNYDQEYALLKKRAAKTGKTYHGNAPSVPCTWEYDFSYDKTRYRQAGFLTKREAEEAEAQKRMEAKNSGIPPRRKGSLSLRQVMDELLDYRTATNAPNTVINEKRKAKQLFLILDPDKKIQNTTVREVQQYQKKRIQNGIHPHTVNLELTLLRRLFCYAIEHGYAQHNPAQQVRNMKVPMSGEVRIPTNREFISLVTAAKEIDQQLYTWIWLIAMTGMRPAESFHLEWQDIDFENDVVLVRPKKYLDQGVNHPLKTKRSNRRINMHPMLKPHLLEWKKTWDEIMGNEPPHKWVFFHPRSTYRRIKSFRKKLLEACRKAGIDWDINHKTFRHFFISTAIMNEVNFQTITSWTGHTSTKMIEQVYGHLASDYKAEQMRKIKFG